MEASEQVVTLQAELKALRNSLDAINAEKIALDQLFIESLKSCLLAKKDVVLNQIALSKAQAEGAAAKIEKENLQKEFDEYKKAHEPVKLEAVNEENCVYD